MGEYEGFVQLVSNMGFPIVITIYLLHRFEKKMDALVESIQTLLSVIEKKKGE